MFVASPVFSSTVTSTEQKLAIPDSGISALGGVCNTWVWTPFSGLNPNTECFAPTKPTSVI